MSVRLLPLFVIAACGPSSPSTRDAPVPTHIPATAAGIFRVTSHFDLAAPPPAAAPLLDGLSAAADDPDGPARFLIDHLIDALPAGEVRTAASELEPWLAAYVETELSEVAPKLGPGLAAISQGLSRYAYHFGTSELWRVELSGATTRTATALQLGEVAITFETLGQPDAFAQTTTSLDATGQLVIAEHALPLAYGGMLRVALDRVVVPSVDPGASDLGRALAELVDCGQLAARVSAKVGVGSPAFYETACDAALARAADEIYAQLAAIDAGGAQLSATGQALGVDDDNDGQMDAIANGAWVGSIDTAGTPAPLGAGAFTNTK